MYSLKKISFEGQASKDAFHGGIDFSGDKVIVTGANTIGKSTVVSGIIWALGLEPIMGVSPGSNDFFQGCMIDKIKLNGIDQDVLASKVTLELKSDDGSRVILEREIRGENTERIYFERLSKTGKIAGNLQVGHRGLKDETKGYFHWLMETLDLPLRELINRDGKHVPIYFENLAPLFLIEQSLGWHDIQARQIYRYGINEIREGSFEYLLGLKKRLEDRLGSQVLKIDEEGLAVDANIIFDDINRLIVNRGGEGILVTSGNIERIRKRFESMDLKKLFFDNAAWDTAKEMPLLQNNVRALEEKLRTGQFQTNSTVDNKISQELIDLRKKVHGLRESLSDFDIQLSEKKKIRDDLEAKRRASADLIQLKNLKVGIIEDQVCPTCGQKINVDDLELDEANPGGLQRMTEVLSRDVEFVKRELKSLDAAAHRTKIELEKGDDELRKMQSNYDLQTKISSSNNKALVELVMEINKLKARIEKEGQHLKEKDEIEKKIETWFKNHLAVIHGKKEKENSEEEKRIGNFKKTFQENLIELKHSALEGYKSAYELDLDEKYRPILNGQPLVLRGSASDRARMIAAFTLALQATAISSGSHPGFTIFDEPKQQNPDDKHLSRLTEFLAGKLIDVPGQVLIFTFLTPIEKERLQGTSIKIIDLGEEPIFKPF